MRWPTPSRSQYSSERLEKQIAREPSPIRSASSSSTTALAALRQIDRERQPDRPGADHDDRMLGDVGAGPILVGVAAIAELDFGLLRHGASCACSGQGMAVPLNSRNCNYLNSPAPAVNSNWSDFAKRRRTAGSA